MKRQRYLIIVLLLVAVQSNGQNRNIIFEQKALDYFADSILNKVYPFKNKVAHFDGLVDSTITPIQFKMSMIFPDDLELMEEYRKTEQATTEFWAKNKKPPFLLEVNDPIKKKSRKHYGSRSKVIRLMVFQSKNVGNRNFVWFRTFINDGIEGYDIYFTLDSEGEILNWYYDTFMF